MPKANSTSKLKRDRIEGRKPKIINVYTITDGNTTTLDWRGMPLIKRIEIGIKLIFYGKIRMLWHKNKYTTSFHGKVKA